ncbi:MAG: UDP-galactopyranose mutase [Muribaculaceae bacterium]|nr:UDP-galactopyranose mutase [Muribaculaceae bacterium]
MDVKYDYLIVGAGLFGATFAHLATKHGKKCLVIDKRNHTGGNTYCKNVNGINVHVYGAHIFHTNDSEIWNLVNSLVPFNRYTNCPVANYKGRLFNLPFNMNTFYQMWGVVTPEQAKAKLEEQRSEAIAALGGREPANLEEQALSLVGRDIYETLIKDYTEKQWGRKCAELPAFIIKRLPVRLTYDNNYFNDRFQGIPIGGYNKLTDALLKGSDVKLGNDFFADREYWETVAEKIVFTGPIDQFFNYCHGKLQYRTVIFEEQLIDTPNYQGNAVINYTDSLTPYTRIIEHKHFEKFGNEVYDNPVTVISKEYSSEWTEGAEPFYPVNDERNMHIYEQYRQQAESEPNVIFGGRLAEYRYYDMAPTISRAIDIFGNER